MDWGEAWRLTLVLAADPASHVAAALAGWRFPLSHEGLALMALFDLQHKSKARRKPKPYPRPWDKAPVRHGTGTVSIDEWKRMKEAKR